MYREGISAKQNTIGYCAVTADILHTGHIRFLNNCRNLCDYLIVGVMTDDCVEKYKGKKPILNQDMRFEIVRNLKGVDKVIFQHTFEFDLFHLRSIEKVDFIFDNEKHNREGADVLIPYTEEISSSLIKDKICEIWEQNPIQAEIAPTYHLYL